MPQAGSAPLESAPSNETGHHWDWGAARPVRALPSTGPIAQRKKLANAADPQAMQVLAVRHRFGRGLQAVDPTPAHRTLRQERNAGAMPLNVATSRLRLW